MFLLITYFRYRLHIKLRKSDVELEVFYANQTWQGPLLLTEAGEPYKPPFARQLGSNTC